MSAASIFVRHRLWGGALGSLLCAGCHGGQTGGEANDPIPAAGGQCEDALRELGLDELSPYGESPAELLAPVLGVSASRLFWSADTAPVSVGPERGESNIELTIEYQGGRIVWRDREPKNSAGTETTLPAAFPSCSDRLEVDVVAHLATAGGALDETIVVTLQMNSSLRVGFSHSLLLDELSGSLNVSAPADVSANKLSVYADWDEVGFHGALSGEVTITRSDGAEPNRGSVGAMSIPFATWPPPSSPPP
jgi:hypothetical protein